MLVLIPKQGEPFFAQTIGWGCVGPKDMALPRVCTRPAVQQTASATRAQCQFDRVDANQHVERAPVTLSLWDCRMEYHRVKHGHSPDFGCVIPNLIYMVQIKRNVTLAPLLSFCNRAHGLSHLHSHDTDLGTNTSQHLYCKKVQPSSFTCESN